MPGGLNAQYDNLKELAAYNIFCSIIVAPSLKICYAVMALEGTVMEL